jgi:hypothetical protein
MTAASAASSTPTGTCSPRRLRVAVFSTKLHNRLLVPLIAADQPHGPAELRAALQVITRHVDGYVERARLPQAA